MMTFPTDSIQDVVGTWWEQCGELKRGSLIYAFVPHVDQVPLTLKAIGRTEASNHSEATIRISDLRISDTRPKPSLPVAALPLHEGEVWTVYRAKKRPCLVLGAQHSPIDRSLRRNMPAKSTSPTLLVAPYYGTDKDGRRAGYNQELIDRIRHGEYPQYMLDYLPIYGPKQSILRLDHIQPIGMHYYAYELSGFCLSDDAVDLILDDWLQWILSGQLPFNCLIRDFQEMMITTFG